MGDGAMCHYCRKYNCVCPEPTPQVDPRDARVAALEAELAEVQRAKYGTPCKCESWMDACREAEETRDKALAELAALRDQNAALVEFIAEEREYHRKHWRVDGMLRCDHLLASLSSAADEWAKQRKAEGAAEAYKAEAAEWEGELYNAKNMGMDLAVQSIFRRRMEDARERATKYEAKAEARRTGGGDEA